MNFGFVFQSQFTNFCWNRWTNKLTSNSIGK